MPEIDEKALEAAAQALFAEDERTSPVRLNAPWSNLREYKKDGYRAEARATILAYESAKAASAREVPEGWKLVPVEPTDEMMKAGAQTDEKAIQGGYLYPDEDSVGLVYAAMLSASPALPVMGAGET